jgi:uncharacterized membrane protein YhaH (DUF805 family)
VSIHTFMLLLATGAALLAAWIVVRFPRFQPSTGAGITVALIGAAATLTGVPHTIAFLGVPLGPLGVIFLVVLPALTYVFLVAAWIMLYVRRALDPYMR